MLLYDYLPEPELLKADVAIVGSGVAGLYAALHLDPALSVIMLNKSGMEQSNSMYAQGGIAAVLDRLNQADSRDQHVADTLLAGAGHCRAEAVRILVDEAAENLMYLIGLGVPFDSRDSRLLLTREGGHSHNRILHCGGDATGLHLTESLARAVRARGNIRLIEQVCLADLLCDEAGAAGLVLLDRQSRPMLVQARQIILASGGIGRIYHNSTNAACATGDGIAAAARSGAELDDMAFVQFHPTALVHPDEHGRFFLISEALRGEGGILRNRRWEPFMQAVHPLADLAPRDIVSRAIVREMQKHDIPCVYLDMTMRPRAFLRERFPTIYETCMQRGIDMAREWIPVVPVQHYFMGGIRTDHLARTSIEGLYACGETACTGVHGANRLASNSLLECLVFGRRAAMSISGTSRPAGPQQSLTWRSGPGAAAGQPGRATDEADLDSISSELRNLMTRQCGIIRNEKELLSARDRISTYHDRMSRMLLSDIKGVETVNKIEVAGRIVQAALERKESLGAHERED